jgi:P27 family predicted phage terminase small subunit
MARGRKPKPKALRLLHGDFRPDRHNADQPDVASAVPRRPGFLRGEAKKEWERITALLSAQRCISEWDMAAITAYCQCWGYFAMLSRKIKTAEDMCQEDAATGQKSLAPLYIAQDKCLKNLRAYAVEFGLTPSSRVKVRAQKEEKQNPFAALMVGKTA